MAYRFRNIRIAFSVSFCLALSFFLLLSGSSTFKGAVSRSFSAEELKAQTPDDEDRALLDGGQVPPEVPLAPRANATFVTLARNSDLWGLAQSIRHVEDRFNSRFHYDWVFLNDEQFSDEFKEITTALVSGTTKYGVIPTEHWRYPEYIDQDRASRARQGMKEKGIVYGDSESYRHMCRFQSGFFFQHHLLQDYKWYWRVEPDIKLFCDISYDPFLYMEQNNKTYGFTITLYEFRETIVTLWDHVNDFFRQHPEYLAADRQMSFISDDGGLTYNLCHFWSNFEIGNLNWYRSKPYMEFFKHLDKQGGFFYERWGDAPIHSLAAVFMLHKANVHYFYDIGYQHPPYTHCPTEQDFRIEHKCHCNPYENFDWDGYSCMKKYYHSNDMVLPSIPTNSIRIDQNQLSN